mgnify:CR=1 FL=1
MNAYLVDYQLDVLQVRTFGVQAGLVMPVFRQGKRGLFLSNTDNTDITDIIVSHQWRSENETFPIFLVAASKQV